jgi:hypothetical protein
MTDSYIVNRKSAFRIRRPVLSTAGLVTNVDADVKAHLDELNTLLGKRFIANDPEADVKDKDLDEVLEENVEAADRHHQDNPPHSQEAKRFLIAYLAPKRVELGIIKKAGWAQYTIGDLLSDAHDDDNNLSLADHIDLTPKLSQLKYALKQRFEDGWHALKADARAVLQGRSAIQDYLIARAYHVVGLRDAEGMFNHIVGNLAGVRSVVNYAAVSAARTVIDREQLRVPDFNKDNSDFVAKIKLKPISLSPAGFNKTLRSAINDIVFNSDAAKILEEANIGKIPPELKPILIRYIQAYIKAGIPIDSKNIDQFLPLFIDRAIGEGAFDLEEPDFEAGEPGERSFRVQFQDNDEAEPDIDRDSVYCAAQLFHSNVLGEELGVFDAVNYLVHRRMLTGGGMQVRDRKLRDDLQRYVFENKFIDLGRDGNPEIDRTRPAERQMFARQVFNTGKGRGMEGMLVNPEWRQLWEVLILETARYLDRAQAAFDPASFVSKQNVMQAVEDLQYNLSTYCVGMAPVMAPMADAELNFVLSRILEHPEIAGQVLPTGGSWKRVVDKLNAERPTETPIPAAALLYSKAKLGEVIIVAIAEYTPAAFEDDRVFSTFVGQVDAYITAESKLQKRKPSQRTAQEDEEPVEPGVEGEHDVGDGADSSGKDDWDF